MREPLHKHEKDPADLAQPRRPLMIRALLLQGYSLDTRVMPGSAAGAELEASSGSDLTVRERSSDTLQALISTFFMGWMPCASFHV